MSHIISAPRRQKVARRERRRKSARPDYAYNPVPEYPMVLREHGVGGTVSLRVVAKWRSIPAQAGDQKLASWVEFPIRFT